MPFGKLLFNKAISKFGNFMFGLDVDDWLCGFTAFTAEGYKKMKLKENGYLTEIEQKVAVSKLCQKQ